MLQAGPFGRPRVAWALDAGVVVLAIALLLGADPILKALAVVMILWRAVVVLVGFLVWRRSAEARARR